MRPEQENITESNALIAPNEVRELLARLTEQSIDAIPANESRTLEGLAVETGIPLVRLKQTLAEMREKKAFSVPPIAWVFIAFLAGLSVWMLRPSSQHALNDAPQVATTTPSTRDISGLESATGVTFGPDFGISFADTGFVPSQPLAEGLSIAVLLQDVVWGSGDHRAKAIEKPLNDRESNAMQRDIEELLAYARNSADRRHLWPPGAAHTLRVQIRTYYGSASAIADFSSSDPNPEKKAAKYATEQLAALLKQWAQMKRSDGP